MLRLLGWGKYKLFVVLLPSQAGSCPRTYVAAGWGLVPSPQVGSVLRGPGWNVHGDSILFQLKKIRFEPGLFMHSFNLGVKFEFYFRCGDEELVSF